MLRSLVGSEMCIRDRSGSPRTPSPWPLDGPEWRDLAQLPGQSEGTMLWDQEEPEGWTVTGSVEEQEDWGGLGCSAMSMSPESCGDGWSSVLDQDEQLKDILYRCINDLQELQETLDDDRSFFSREELMQERVVWHQERIESTVWELDLCISRANILIELLQSTDTVDPDRYALSFVASMILQIPVVASHVSTSRQLVLSMRQWLTHSTRHLCPVALHQWCKVVQQVATQGLDPSAMVEYCRGMLPFLASPSVAALFSEMAHLSKNLSNEQQQIMGLLRGPLLAPDATADVMTHACSVLGEIVSSSAELGSSTHIGRMEQELLAHALTRGCNPTLTANVLGLHARMLGLEASCPAWHERGASHFFEATRKHIGQLCSLLWGTRGTLQLNTARVLCTLLQAPGCSHELALQLLQALSQVFLSGRTNDLVRNMLLSTLGDCMQGTLTVLIFKHTSLLADTYAAYQQDFKAHNQCSRAHLAMLCSFIVGEASANPRCREAIEGVQPWDAFLAKCDAMSSECQHISNRVMSSVLEQTFENPQAKGITVH
eukprot:TRINITY_DN12645_c0_g1_i2.p1 TRINITY_DN12645_c0_g1~~TRINITY_DN12645_c0_g1_i2.p1  ORF type:complete len:545 (-),score=123.17 TRINITY_DN12645_c0_g1_i2:145-1779(-)